MLAHCPLCQAAYDDASVHLLGDFAPQGNSVSAISRMGQGKPRMFHLTCKNCRHAVLAVILESGHGVSSIGLVTDLEVQDAVRIHGTQAISADDVVRAHVELDTKSREMCQGLLG